MIQASEHSDAQLSGTYPVPRTFEQVSRQQLEIYAKELQELFGEERRLRHQLEDRNLQLEQRLREITAIERMNQTISQHNMELSQGYLRGLHFQEPFGESGKTETSNAFELSADVVLQKVVDLSRELVHASYGALVILEDGHISSFLTSGLCDDERKSLEVLFRDPDTLGMLAQQPQPIRRGKSAPAHWWVGLLPGLPKATNFLGVPILYQGRHRGNLHLMNKQEAQEFSREDESLMVMFATQAAVAIENARIFRQAQFQAILEERDRIGKDLHEGIIQSIFGVGLNLEDCADIVVEEPLAVKQRLEFAVGCLNEVIRDIRNYIVDLRPELSVEKTLGEGLQDLVKEFSNNHRINVVLNRDLEGIPPLSPYQTAHLLAIAREGLTNVAKHAGARSVSLGLSYVGEVLRLWIQDDGTGFNAEAPKHGTGQGLRNMKDRAETLGGQLLLESSLGGGTRIEIILGVQDQAPLSSRDLR